MPSTLPVSARYLRPKLLAAGGMSMLYWATDQFSGQIVVLKTALPGDPQQRATANARLGQEARMLGALQHPAIPQLVEHVSEGPLPALVLEYRSGTDLDQLLIDGDPAAGQHSYSPQEIARWGAALCFVLAYLHDRPQPMIHHDIKPANIILDRRSDTLTLIDFGSAEVRAPNPDGTFALPPSSLYGTAGYAPPEQYRGQSEPRSDVYALAATLYHLATNDDPSTHPFHFPLLDQLGELGQLLRPALDPAVVLRPDAAQFGRDLARLANLTGVLPLYAPDRNAVTDAQMLVAWCEQHWQAARLWLAGSLPAQLALWWNQPTCAAQLQALIAQHPDPDVALDAALAMLDPDGFGAASPSIVVDPLAVDFGVVPDTGGCVRTFTIHNAGRRVVQLTIEPPPFSRMIASQVNNPCAPGAQTRASLTLQSGHVPTAARMHGTITIRTEQQVMATLPITARGQPWYAHIRRAPLRWTAALLLCGALGNWGRYMLHDNNGAAALARRDWVLTRQELQAIDNDPAAYHLVRESYYLEGVAALERGAWPEARAAFQQLVGGYRDSEQLLSESYYREGLQSGLIDQRLDGNHNLVDQLAFTPDGRTLLAADWRRHIRRWRLPDHAPQPTLTIPDTDSAYSAFSFFAVSADGQHLLVAIERNVLQVWRLHDSTPLMTITLHNPGPYSAIRAISPDGQTIASADDTGVVGLWSVGGGPPQQRLAGHTTGVSAAAFHPNGQILATGDWDGTIRLWRVRDGVLLQTLNGHRRTIETLVFSPDGQTLASSSWEGTVNLWRTRDGAVLQMLAADSGFVSAVVFSPDGQLLATSGADLRIKLWNVRDGSLRRTLTGHGYAPRALAFSPDGQRLASADEDGVVLLWRIPR